MASNDVDSALSLPAVEVGPALAGLTEDQWYDRKSIQVAPRKLAELLVAFANAEGGVAVVGLSDSGNVEGIDNEPSRQNHLRQAAINFTNPPVRTTFTTVECINAHGRTDHLLVARVDPGERVHETTDGNCYLRVGDQSHRLNYVQRQELAYDRGQAQFDGLPAGDLSLSALDIERVEYLQAIVGHHGPIDQLLKARSLLTRNGLITNAGLLLFGANPQDVFPQAYVRILRFLDVHRGTGARLGLEDDADLRVEGPIPEIIEQAQAAIEEMIPKRRALGLTGRFEAVPIVPRDAWLEGLVNAVIHRSYSLSGDHIRFEIYPNRIEIESPGRFPGLANPNEPLQISRFARNPRIARVCADLRLGQELGEGIRRIFDEMRRLGLSDPIYTQTQGSVRLTLTSVPRLDPKTAARLPVNSQQVINALRNAGQSLGTGDLVDLLGWSRPYLLVRLRALEAEGMIRWIGKSPRDPRAVWMLDPYA